MRAIVVPFGSHGDVHPLIGVARELRSRGHAVTFLQPEHFAPLIRAAGFEVKTFGEAGQYEAATRDPDLWHPTKAFPIVAKWATLAARQVYDLIEETNVPGETVLVAGTIALGALLAEEKLGIPLAAVHLQPTVFHSNYHTAIYGGRDLNFLPRWLKTWLFDQVFGKVIEPHIAPQVNALRAELGLPPVSDLMRKWIHSSTLGLAFFPRWFAEPQPDWPKNVEMVGFPLYDEADVTPLSPELLGWLDEGPPPIAFTPGSANLFGRPFFEAAAEACVRLKRRGILLTRFAEQVPENLPDGVRHFSYAPFSQLLPRTAAIVHHGGIGTASQGMAAGVPQFVMPLAHDQFDNASRMEKLGIARWLGVKKFTGRAVAKKLEGWIDSPQVLAACQSVKERLSHETDSMTRAAVAIEGMAAKAGVR